MHHPGGFDIRFGHPQDKVHEEEKFEVGILVPVNYRLRNPNNKHPKSKGFVALNLNLKHFTYIPPKQNSYKQTGNEANMPKGEFVYLEWNIFAFIDTDLKTYVHLTPNFISMQTRR